LWVRRNGKTCFSGNCHCVYAPYYREVKGKRKPWTQAVNEKMSKFTEREQREILGTYAMLERFKAGEDIEKIFNTIRPKYPIRKYADVLRNVEIPNEKLYNRVMRNANEKELKEFLEFDKKIYDVVKNLNKDNFKDLWTSEWEYKKHLKKRVKKEHITDVEDYIQKIKDAFLNPDDIKWKKYKKDYKEKANRWDRFYYKKGNFWVNVFVENGKLATAFEIEKDYIEIISRGDKNTFEIIDIDKKEVKNVR
jgi:hypothetical protein